MANQADMAQLRRILRTLEEVNTEAQFMRLKMAAQEEGGHFKPACPGDPWDSGRIELKVRGIYAAGASPDRVVDEWRRGAQDTLDRHQAVTRAIATLHQRNSETRPAIIVSACDTIIAFDSGPMIDMARQIKREVQRSAA